MNEQFQISDIEILISTQNQGNFSFLEELFSNVSNLNFSILIVNQTTENKILVSDNEHIKVVNSFEKGLSKSRNLAIRSSSKKLLLFTDDDVVFEPDFSTKICEAFNKYPNNDGFRFQFYKAKNQFHKKYPKTFKSKLSIFEILNTSSIELVLKKKIVEKNIFFDENFGLGTPFCMGEEGIFLHDLIKNNLKIGFVPEAIVSHAQPSTTNKITIEQKYFTFGAIYFRIFKDFYLIWLFIKLFFDLKHKLITPKLLYLAIKNAVKGKKSYEQNRKL